MQTTTYELRCRRTLKVKMFLGLSAEKADQLNHMLRTSGSSCRFIPQTPLLLSMVESCSDGVRGECSALTA